MLDWTFTFTANDPPSVYIANFNLLRTNAQAIADEVVAARGVSANLSTAIAAGLAGKADSVHGHSADQITSGRFAPERMGNGLADNTKWLRGDAQWLPLPTPVVAWGGLIGELEDQTDLADALAAKADTGHGHTLADLDQSSAAPGQVPAWDGMAWVPISPTAAGVTAWGSIGGSLSDQSDLQAALDGKASSAHNHSISNLLGFGAAGGYLRSDGLSWQRVSGIPYSDLTGVPATFTPAAHGHSASEITAGTFSTARIPNLPAAQITSGVFSPARLGSGVADNTTWLNGSGQYLPLPAAPAASWGSIGGGLAAQTDLKTALDAKAPLSSPPFTDTPTAPTAAPGTNTTQLANTAFVQAALALKASLNAAAFTGDISTTGNFSRKNANNATLTPQPRVFVQSVDPGAAAADGDLWFW